MGNYLFKTKIIALIMVLFSLSAQAQNAVTVAGGEAVGTGGTASYSVGQVGYQSISSSTGTVSAGVQQPYEISVTSIDNVSGITLSLKAYPNPTQGDLWLSIEDYSGENLSFQLYDFNGKLIMTQQVRDNQTLISLNEFASATYFVRIISENSEIKTFKIIKN